MVNDWRDLQKRVCLATGQDVAGLWADDACGNDATNGGQDFGIDQRSGRHHTVWGYDGRWRWTDARNDSWPLSIPIFDF
jgi:hypothetical protein